jgi:hypothetical protein
MPKEMLVTLWSIEYSEKNRIKKLIFEISFNCLQNRRISCFLMLFYPEILNLFKPDLYFHIQTKGGYSWQFNIGIFLLFY